VFRYLKTVFVAASYPFFVGIRGSVTIFFRDWGKVTGMTKHRTARTDLGLGLVCAFPTVISLPVRSVWCFVRPVR